MVFVLKTKLGVSVPPFGCMMATRHPPSISDVLYDGCRLCLARPSGPCSGGRDYASKNDGHLGRSNSEEKHARIVLGMVACEAPNAQGKAERLTTTTIRHFENMMATSCQSGITGEAAGKSSYVRWAFRLFRLFIAVGDADTPWHPQFFRPVNLESQRWDRRR